MKCPKCMEKPLDWSGVPVTTLCPKCGNEMIEDFVDDGETTYFGEPVSTLKLICMNEDCGHEEKVKADEK